MKRVTAILLAAVALIAGAVFVLRPASTPESPRRSGGGPSPETTSAPAPPPLALPAPAPVGSPPPAGGDATKTCLVLGTVRLAAPPPRRKPIPMDADPACAALHSAPMLSEAIVTGADFGLRWAFVYVRKGALPVASPSHPVLLVQDGCRYEPHVLGIQVGQLLLIRNNDSLLHNIHALPFSNKEFNFGQPSKGMEEARQFITQEIMVKVKCDVHPWMSAWIGVLEHPYFAVTDAAGAYSLPELPAGRYELEVWHETYRSVSRTIDLRPGDRVEANFQLDARK